MSDLYNIMKGNAYALATTIAGKTNADAQSAGFKDVFDYIMSDSDDPRQPLFIHSVMEVLSESQRQILLDGMAREYAGVDGWLAYVDCECT